MRVAVMATGGIGGYYGGLLARDGHDVSFIARGKQLEAICERGLHIKSIDSEFTIHPAHATSNPAEIGPVDLVLFSVKTYDTARAVEMMRPLMGPETTIITFQNGIDSHGEIAAVVGADHVLAAPTQIVTFISGPGEITQISPFRMITVGEMNGDITPRVEQIAALFRPSHIDVTITRDIRRALWAKFLRLASLGLCTLARTPPFDLFQSEWARETLRGAMNEVLSVGRAEGVDLGETAVQEAVDWVLALKPGQKPSMLTDLERGNRLEIDALSGAVVRVGKQHNIPTPVHQTVYVALKPIDERHRAEREGRG